MSPSGRSGSSARTNLLVVALALMILFVLTSVTPGRAVAATKQPFSAAIVIPPGGPSCDRLWIDEDDVIHARGCVQSGTITGDIEGEVLLRLNMNLASVGENGPQEGVVNAKGTITMDGGEVAYTLSMSVVFAGGVGTGSFIMRGVNEFAGTHVMGTITVNGDDPAEMIGIIFTA